MFGLLRDVLGQLRIRRSVGFENFEVKRVREQAFDVCFSDDTAAAGIRKTESDASREADARIRCRK